jgi:catechol 2,3-dioxygenase-like lactoylglutathione lyase family enzyme
VNTVTVTLKGIGWVTLRTTKVPEMAKFYEDVFGLAQVHERPGRFAFRLPNGDTVEGTLPPEDNPFTTGPIPGFEVDDVIAARAEMEAAGVRFVGEMRGGAPHNTWSFYYAPDGNIYFICQRGEQG